MKINNASRERAAKKRRCHRVVKARLIVSRVRPILVSLDHGIMLKLRSDDGWCCLSSSKSSCGCGVSVVNADAAHPSPTDFERQLHITGLITLSGRFNNLAK